MSEVWTRSPAAMPNPEVLSVSILYNPLLNRDPLTIYAQTVTGKNQAGTFDILPEHANFITPIQDEVLVNRVDGMSSYKFREGMLEVAENKVKIFIKE